MTRKIIILFLGYIVLGVITFTSCEDLLEYEATICDIQFTGLYTSGNDNIEPDILQDKIGFVIRSIKPDQSCYFPNIQLFSSAYATTKCAEFKNQLLKSSYQISVDRPILFNNDTIDSYTDLLNIPEITSLTEIDINVDCKFVVSTIIFKPELVTQLDFGTGEYEVTFKCATNDNRNFTKTRTVIFKE